jgi:hypothetical protein
LHSAVGKPWENSARNTYTILNVGHGEAQTVMIGRLSDHNAADCESVADHQSDMRRVSSCLT